LFEHPNRATAVRMDGGKSEGRTKRILSSRNIEFMTRCKQDWNDLISQNIFNPVWNHSIIRYII